MEERLNRLERENRRLKTVGVLALAVMAAACDLCPAEAPRGLLVPRPPRSCAGKCREYMQDLV